MEIRSFRDLVVWQKSMDLVERVYEVTDCLPRSEQFGLSIQLRRAAISIPSNIAEGHARQTGYYLNHLNMAIGSQAELQTQLELAYRLHFVDRERVAPVMEAGSQVAKMLHRLVASLER
jgi:four helix bundle protein